MSQIFTSTDSLLYSFNRDTKQSFCCEKSPQVSSLQKVCWVRSLNSSMQVVFFDIRGVGHYDLVPKGRTVHSHLYCCPWRLLWTGILSSAVSAFYRHSPWTFWSHLKHGACVNETLCCDAVSYMRNVSICTFHVNVFTEVQPLQIKLIHFLRSYSI